MAITNQAYFIDCNYMSSEAYLSSLSVWQTNLIAHKISFGKYFVIVSSEGGLCLIIHKIIGPFQG